MRSGGRTTRRVTSAWVFPFRSVHDRARPSCSGRKFTRFVVAVKTERTDRGGWADQPDGRSPGGVASVATGETSRSLPVDPGQRGDGLRRFPCSVEHVQRHACVGTGLAQSLSQSLAEGVQSLGDSEAAPHLPGCQSGRAGHGVAGQRPAQDDAMTVRRRLIARIRAVVYFRGRINLGGGPR
jgi:hypothetical protein